MKLTRHYTSSDSAWLLEKLVKSVPKPFGSSAAQAQSLNWWHNHYNFVFVGSSKWVVVKGTGAVIRFIPCAGATCTATALGGSLNKRERLQRTTLGFSLLDTTGRKFHFEAKHVGTDSQERFFLSRIVSPSGILQASHSYSAPSGLTCPSGAPGSAAGVPYLSSITTPSGALDFQYAQLTSVHGASECVVRSVTRRGESSPSVIYSYAQDSGSVERPGLVAQATLGSKVFGYTYSGAALTSSVGNMLVTRHDYGANGSVTTASSPGGQLTIGVPSTSSCESGSDCCGIQPQAVTTTDTTAGRGDGVAGAPGFLRTIKTLANTDQTNSPRLYQTTDSCGTLGACSPGTERYEWECASAGVPAHERARKNKRDFWEVYTHASPASGTGIPASILEMTSVKKGATDMTGTGALEEETFSYTYGPNGEQLIATAEKPSVIGASGQKARTFHRYDSSGRRAATIQSGWTRVFNAAAGTWSSQQRWVATFFLTTRTGESTPDPLGRTLEKRGPCIVPSEAATDCVSGTTFPVTRSYYWADSETTPRRNQLQKVASYPAGLSGAPLETFYNAYDASGHPTEVVDANGVTTLFSYQDEQLMTQTVRVSGQPDVVTFFGYDSAGNQTSILHPQGNYEVFCFREGTTSGCTGGTLTNKLQWKAKSSTPTAASWVEKVAYSYWPDGTVKEERFLDASGNTRKLLSFAADAHRRPTWAKTGAGAGSFVSARSFDAADNETGVGIAYNSPPAWCAAGLDGQPTSPACVANQFDGANRLVRVDEHPTGSSTTRTCIKYDAHGNAISVDMGLTSTTDCATATASTKASRYLYDDFGYVVEVTLPATGTSIASGTTRFTYDALGKVLVKQTPAMAAASPKDYLGYAYDTLGRMLSTTHFSPLVSGGSEGLFAMGYDASATLPASCGALANTRGRLLFQDDSFGRTWFSYDAWGRVVKEVRLRVGTSTCSPSTPYQNPHTLYGYSLNGNLTQVTYPYGRTVTYTYGAGALADRVSGVDVLTYSSGGATSLTPLVSQVAWEPYGGLRGYRTHFSSSLGSVEYALGDNSSSAPSSCPSALPVMPGDSTGRIRALWVSSLSSGANFTPGSGNGALFKQIYTWQADQLSRSDSCLLGASSPRTETYAYDGMLRLTAATGALATEGGAFAARAFGHDGRGNHVSESGDTNSWTLSYGSGVKADLLASRISAQANAQLGYSYTYDADGRVSRKQWLAGPASSAFFLEFSSGPSASGATDSVFKAIDVNGLTYNYFYDALGKRRLKHYPTGIKDEFFYNLSRNLLVDQGNTSSLSAGLHPIDEYVWLDGHPIAVIRGKLDASWAHLSDATSDCARLGEAASCGVYHLVTDYIGKPVLSLDSLGRVTGVGEYDALGHVNRVSVDNETPHPYTTSTSHFGVVMKQPVVAGTTLRQRVLVDALDLWRDAYDCPSGPFADLMDAVSITDATTGVVKTMLDSYQQGRNWTSWFSPGAAGVRSTLTNSAAMSCIAGSNCNGIRCEPTCTCTPRAPDITKPYEGAVVSAYEYRRFQSGAAHFWPPLRLPGQYHDVETDLFENWNRFYDPSIGRYLQPEPILQNPIFVQKRALEGMSVPAYAYANNNALYFTDTNGLYSKHPKCENTPSEEAVYRMMEQTVSVVKDKELFWCILRQIENAHVTCDIATQIRCGKRADLGGYAKLGTCAEPTKEIHWCSRKMSPECQAKAMIHEMAHSCGWNHNLDPNDPGKGVPGENGVLECEQLP
ncbi:RHS repeat-associated core domain-containing protein [Myxococcus sp. AB025B]|uniref:RHS repeat-associated core domain-containing protein n=1 Tax=Myxococcus sp. AB025B TaxID=2562794 RepID=UPI0011447528|nr:RHS repeat-associated core domain-containing protein [Myxococcus sp. AB025B]